jgi:hypothetical protein
MTMSSGPRLIQSKGILLAVLAFCALQAVASWNGMRRPAPATHDLVLILGVALGAFFCANIVVKTTSIGERIVFGPILLAGFLIVLIRTVLPNQQTAHVLRAVEWLMWLVSLVAGVVILVRKPKELSGPDAR